ncbi:MAG: SDR family NAD(P)-dependent oxidoreductase [Myxococcota bacterium]
MNQNGLFSGKVVIITGAGGGIGRAHALAFAKEGAQVVVNDVGTSRDGSGEATGMAAQVVAEIQALGGQAAANTDSVATMQGAENLLKTALDAFGRVDILVNNAGILRDKTLLKMEEPMWDAVIAVHLKGTFCCTQVVAKKLVEQNQGGRIINTTSYAGLIGNFGQSNYAAAKAGIYGFTVTTALELRSKGITVNSVAPMAKTRMTTDIDAIPDEMAAEQISPMVLFLASDLAADVTGKNFGVHGQQVFAYTMKMNEGVTKSGKDLWTVAEIHKQYENIIGEGKPAAAAPASAPAAAPALPADPVAATFELIPLGFVAEKAAGKSFNIYFDIKGGGGQSLILADGKLSVAKGQSGTPTCTTTVDPETFVAIFSGKIKAESAFMQGKIKATNLQNMMALGQVLDAKKAQAALAARGMGNVMSGGAAPAAAAAPAPAPAAPADPVSETFSLVPLGFVPEKAAGKSFNIFFDIKGGPAHSLILADGKLSVAKGQSGTPTCTTSTDAETIVAIFSGKMKAESAFMQGKIKASNLQNMMALGQVLDAKKAQAALAARPAPAAPAAAAPAAPAAPADPVAEAFALIPLGFVAEKGAGKKFNIYFEVAGGSNHSIILADGKLEVVKGQSGTPSCTTKTDAETAVAIFTAKMKAESAFMQGKIKASNLADMMALGQVLDAKKAQAVLAARGPATVPAAGAAGRPADMMGAAAPGGDPVTEAFSLLPQAFKKDKAGSWKATIHFEIKGSSDRTLDVADGHVKVLSGKIGNADCLIKTDSDTIAGLLTGKVDGQKAFMQGKISASNMGVLMKFSQFFTFDASKVAPAAAAAATVAAGAVPAPVAASKDRKAFVGRRYENGYALPKAEEMTAYAKAVNDHNPAFLDASREGGIMAHPIFPVRLFNDLLYKVATDPDLELDLVRLVHGEQDMRIHEPVHPMDILQLRARLEDIQEKDSGTLVTGRIYAYKDGRVAVEALTGLFIRARARKKDPSEVKAAEPVEKIPAVVRGEPTLVASFGVDKDQASRYADASLDRNPIHLDEGAARSAGLPGIILHGLCTMAMSTRPIIESLAGGDPARLKRFAVRFSKPVFPGDTLTVKAWKDGEKDGRSVYAFEVTNGNGVAVVTHGIAEIA